METASASKHISRLFGLTLWFAACTVTPTHPSTPDNTLRTDSHPSVEDLAAKTVALVGYNRDKELKAYCSGVWVGAKTILTASHCLQEVLKDEGGKLTYAVRQDVLDEEGAELANPRVRGARVSALDVGHDLALLETDAGQTPRHEIAHTATAGILPGASVATMGHPMGLWYSYSAGHVAAVRVLDIGPTAVYVQTTAPTSRGNSGCGLFNGLGELVGVSHANVPAGSNLAFYVHAKHVEEFLKGRK